MPLLKLLGADADTITATSAYLNWTVSIGAVPAILNMVMASMIRSEGAALHASIGIMSGCFLNIILDPFFILPQWLGMQAEGAAIATLLSNCGAHVYFLTYLYLRRGRTSVCILPGYFSLRKDIVTGVFTVGIPALIQNILNVFSSIILNSLASVHGATALAAMGICIRINMVPMYVAMGISHGIMPLIGYNYASKNILRMKTSLIFTARISLFLSIIASVFFFFYPGFFVRQFIADGETVALGTQFLRGFSLALPFLCLDFLAVITFQAIGKGKEALIFALMRKLVFELPLLYLLNWLFPLYGLPYALPIAEIMMAMIASLVLMQLFQREPITFERRKYEI
jgi:putative MATE family efflux protein